jgi:hypothetical protein
VWLDGATEIALATSQDTQSDNNSDNLFNMFNLRGTSGQAVWIDDLYMRAKTTNVTTPADEVFGDITINTIYPDANGTNRDFTPSTGTDDYAVVDETPATVSDYVASSTSADKVTLGVSTGATTKQVYGVAVNTWAGVDTPGVQNIKHVVRSNGADYLSPTAMPLGDTAHNNQSFWITDPGTAASWTIAGVNAAEFGIRNE